MKLTPVLAMVLLVLVSTMSCAASDNDFDAVVLAVEHRYRVHAQRVPVMGFVSFCAHLATGGGVKGVHIAEFEHVANIADTEELSQLISVSLGDQWQHFITEREVNNKLSVIFVRLEGNGMRMLIADMDHGELDVLRMELNGQHLAEWMREPRAAGHHHSYEPR